MVSAAKRACSSNVEQFAALPQSCSTPITSRCFSISRNERKDSYHSFNKYRSKLYFIISTLFIVCYIVISAIPNDCRFHSWPEHSSKRAFSSPRVIIMWLKAIKDYTLIIKGTALKYWLTFKQEICARHVPHREESTTLQQPFNPN